MAIKRMGLCVIALILCSACGAGKTESPRQSPVRSHGKPPYDAPEIWREYLIGARAADQIADPLKRCLAFPDLPGNHWPEGHSRAHCYYHAASVMTLEDTSDFLQRGDVAGLEKRIDIYRDKHFSRNDFGEDIHSFFDIFSNTDARIDTLTRRWLELAPKSAYAHLARANYYREIAVSARGEKTIDKVPASDLRRMSEAADRAIPLFQEAIALEPKLMPAYVRLFELAMIDSRHELMAEALKGAREQDPACIDLAGARMRSLQPRWGGTHEEMMAYAQELAGHIKQRPHLAVHLGDAYTDQGDVLVLFPERMGEADEALKKAVDIGSNESSLWLGAMAAQGRTDIEPDLWRAAAYLLQAARFQPVTAWSNRTIAARIGFKDPEWAVRYAKQAVDLEPDNGSDRMTLAGLLNRSGRYREALPHLLIASEKDDFREVGLSSALILMMEHPEVVTPKSAPRPEALADRMMREFPNNPYGWLYRIRLDQRADIAPSPEHIRRFLSVAYAGDPKQRAAIEEFGGASPAAQTASDAKDEPASPIKAP